MERLVGRLLEAAVRHAVTVPLILSPILVLPHSCWLLDFVGADPLSHSPLALLLLQSNVLLAKLQQLCACRLSAKEVQQLTDEAVGLLVFSTHELIARIDQTTNQAGGKVYVD